MQLGALNTRCRVERKSVTIEQVYGTEVVTWELLAVIWCGVQDDLPSRSEAVKQGLAISINRARVRTRYRNDIDSSMRLVINRPSPLTYQIIAGPATLGDKDGIEFMVERVSS